MIFGIFETLRKTYSRLTFTVKMAIVAAFLLVIFSEYRRTVAEQSDTFTTDAVGFRAGVRNRIYALATTLSRIYE